MKYRLTSVSRPLEEFIPNIRRQSKDSTRRMVFQIEAVIDMPLIGVKRGEKGGWVESERNLDQRNDCWIGANCLVYGEAEVQGNAVLKDDIWLGDTSSIGKNSLFSGHARIRGGHSFTNVQANTTNLNTSFDTKGVWQSVDGGQIMIQGKLNVFAKNTIFSANGHLEGNITLSGEENTLSGLVELSGKHIITNSQLRNVIATGELSVSDSYLITESPDYHSIDGNVVMKNDSLFGVMFIKGTSCILENTINEGITELLCDSNEPLTFQNVTFTDIISITHDTQETLIADTEFHGDLHLLTSDMSV